MNQQITLTVSDNVWLYAEIAIMPNPIKPKPLIPQQIQLSRFSIRALKTGTNIFNGAKTGQKSKIKQR